jgi:hypothetical protein
MEEVEDVGWRGWRMWDGRGVEDVGWRGWRMWDGGGGGCGMEGVVDVGMEGGGGMWDGVVL